MTDKMEETALRAEVEKRARKICEAHGKDPDAILDNYGPVRGWDAVAYHINEAIDFATRPQADLVAELVGAVSAYVERIDHGSPVDTDYVTGLMRTALTRIEAQS